MKPLLVLWLLIAVSLRGYSQVVLIDGKLISAKNNIASRIVVNDTLRKFYKSIFIHNNQELEKIKTIEATLIKSGLLYKPDVTGKFKISAKLKDTIYFSDNKFITQKYAVADLIKKHRKLIRLKPVPCINYQPCGDTLPEKTYVFIGEMIDWKTLQEPNYCIVKGKMYFGLDVIHQATYRILKQVYGQYKSDTITFKVYVHFGRPDFSNFKYVMLFVSEYCGELIHEKYQYFEVYPTKDNRWASPGDPYRQDRVEVKDVKAVPMQFTSPVYYNPKKLHLTIERKYEDPYFFKVNDTTSVPLLGAYSEDLLRVKMKGNLKRLFVNKR